MSKDQKDFFKQKNDWSEIKDSLLAGYLPQYFQKLLTSKIPICYVDCFAGKGKFDDGKWGSPLIAMKIINTSVKKSKIAYTSGTIQPCFIELNHASELSKNFDDISQMFVKPEIVSGKFEDRICEILKGKCGHNVFLYIDPYGVRSLDSTLFDTFKTYGFKSFEMLINFNSFGFFRDACRAMKVDVSDDEAFQGLENLIEYEPTEINATKQSKELLTRIAGGDYWKDIVRDYKSGHINGYQAERRLSMEYKQRLKQDYKYVLDMPIRLKPNQRPKYRMIHVCDHKDGCYLMADNMLRRKNELFINIQQNGQFSLFDTNASCVSTVENDMLTEDAVEKMVREHILIFKHDIGLTTFLAEFCSTYGVVCPFKMIYDILEKMEKTGDIDIIRSPAFTEKRHQKTSFWVEKNNKTIVIRRHKQ